MGYPAPTSTAGKQIPLIERATLWSLALAWTFVPAKEKAMKLNAPKQITFLISVILVLIGVLVVLGIVPFLPVPAFWLAVIGYTLLAFGCLLPGL